MCVELLELLSLAPFNKIVSKILTFFGFVFILKFDSV